MPAGNISGDWTSAGNPYNVNGDVRVAPGESLTIGPGVEINFTGHHIIRVLGNIDAQGAAGDSIIFTAPSQNPGWGGIKLDSLDLASDTARFAFCSIGNMKNTSINIINTSKVRFDDCRFHDNLDMYIGATYVALGDPKFHNCKWDFNDSNSGSEGAAMYIWDASPEMVNCQYVANYSPWSAGGVTIYRSDVTPYPKFINCLFKDNETAGGGSAVVSHSNCVPYFENCDFIDNSSGSDGGVVWDGYTIVGTTQFVDCHFEGNHSGSEGGCFYLVSTRVSWDNCTFVNNDSQSSRGAAIYAYDEAELTIEGCDFTGNYTTGQGGAIYVLDYSTMNVNRSRFANNSASLGGAMVIDAHTTANLTNSIFVNNEASNVGGAFRFVLDSHPTLSNCLIANNMAASNGGALSLYWDADPVLTNCIIWNNEAGGELNTYHVQEYIWNYCNPTFNYCCVEGGEDTFVYDTSGPGAFNNSVVDDPNFVIPSSVVGNTPNFDDADWHYVADESPCQDGGTPDASGLGVGETDFDGGVREIGTIDIGPYEGGQAEVVYNAEIDLDGDGINNIDDLFTFLLNFGCTGDDCVGDFNGDGVVNIADLLYFITQFSTP